MAMKLHLHNIRKIHSSEIELSGITIIAGINEAGKSSVALALAAALTGQAAPLSRKARGADAEMVSAGAKSGTVTLATDGGQVTVAWPSGEVTTKGTPPRASTSAVGLFRFVTAKTDDRAKLFSKVFKAEPTGDDFKRAAAEAGLAWEQAEPAWQMVTTQDWDAAAAHYEQEGRTLKGRWCEASGQRAYGADKAASWEPDGLDLAATLEALRAELVAAEQARDDALASSAVDAARLAELERDAATVPQATEGLAQAEALVARAKRDIEDCDAQLKALHNQSSGADPIPCTCPECGSALEIVGTTLRKPGPLGKTDATASMKTWREALADAHQKLDTAQEAHAARKAALNRASRAHDELKRLRAAGAGAMGGGGDVEKAKQRVERVKAALSDRERYDRAHAINAEIGRTLALVGLLRPAGLRRQKLTEVIEIVNLRLAEMSVTMKVAPVQVTADMQVMIGGRPYETLGGLGPDRASLQWRAEVMLQTLIASHDGSAALVFDGADVLDQANRVGLTRLMLKHWTGKPALLCMTISDRAKMPDLSRIGGQSLWISEGRIEPAAAPVREAA